MDDPTFGQCAIARDTVQGLDFLDVRIPVGLTYDEVLAEFGSGGTFEGFRFATTDEAVALAYNGGYEPDNYEEDTLSALVTLLGVSAVTGDIRESYGMVETNDPNIVYVVRIMDYPTIPNNRDQVRVGTYSRGWISGAFLVRD